MWISVSFSGTAARLFIATIHPASNVRISSRVMLARTTPDRLFDFNSNLR